MVKITVPLTLILIISFLSVLILPACGLYRDTEVSKIDNQDTLEEDGPSVDTVEIEIKDSKFSPGRIKITPGTKITWLNVDSYSHTVTSGTIEQPTGLFDSGTISGGETFSFVFDEEGIFEYFCEYHEGSKGMIEVVSD